jgi:hypothetical protein
MGSAVVIHQTLDRPRRDVFEVPANRLERRASRRQCNSASAAIEPSVRAAKAKSLRGEHQPTGRFDIASRSPHVIAGDRCPSVVLCKHRLRVGSQEVWMALLSRPRMKAGTTIITSLEALSLEEALSYLDSAEGDELAAAFALAKDRNLLDGSENEPDEAEVHHALFLLRRARGLDAPSFDLMRVQLRRLVAA